MSLKPDYNIILCLFIIASLFFAPLIQAQDYKVGYTYIEAIDTSRDNRELGFYVYYPSVEEGRDKPPARDAAKAFPLVSFGHGYLMKPAYYSFLWEAIVKEGYVFVIADNETNLFPSHADLGLDLVFVIKYLENESLREGSLFHGMIAPEYCLMGHSMGGGSAVLGARSLDNLSSIVLMAPFDTKPSAISAAGDLAIPALVIAGTNDCVTLPHKHALPLYNNMGGDTCVYISIKGGNHCNMAMKNKLCNAAERTIPRNKISREEQHMILLRYIIPWLDFTLKSSAESVCLFERLIKSDTSLTYKGGIGIDRDIDLH